MMTNTLGPALASSAPAPVRQCLTKANNEGSFPFMDCLDQMLQTKGTQLPSAKLTSAKGGNLSGALSLLDGLGKEAKGGNSDKDSVESDPPASLTALLFQTTQMIQIIEKEINNNSSSGVPNQAFRSRDLLNLNQLFSEFRNSMDLPHWIKDKLTGLLAGLNSELNELEQPGKKPAVKLLNDLNQFSTLLKQQIAPTDIGKSHLSDQAEFNNTENASFPLVLVNQQDSSNPHASSEKPNQSQMLQKVSISDLRERLEPYFVNSMKVDGKDGVTKLFLQLEPEHLGKLELTIQSNNGLIDATLSVNNSDAKKVIEDQLSSLKQNLLQQGIVVDRLEVTQMSENPNTAYLFQQQKQQSHEQRQHSHRPKKNQDYMDFADEIESVYQVPVNPSRFGVNYTI
jgi:flagellar hook-length control protein FliK